MKTTVIMKIKRGGGFGRWPAYEFTSDEYGRWLYSPKGTIYRGHGADGQVTEIEVGQGDRAEGLPVMHLIPSAGWWLAAWWELDGVRHISVEICRPAEVVGGDWTFVDLELDPRWSSDGELRVADEDEFAAAVETGVITPDEAMHARAAADDILVRLRGGDEPFGAVGWKRYDDALVSQEGAINALPPTHSRSCTH